MLAQYWIRLSILNTWRPDGPALGGARRLRSPVVEPVTYVPAAAMNHGARLSCLRIH